MSSGIEYLHTVGWRCDELHLAATGVYVGAEVMDPRAQCNYVL